MHSLVTGGLGFIDSHTVVQLLENGYIVTIIDNLSNYEEGCVDQIKQLCPKYTENPLFYKVDLLSRIKILILDNKSKEDMKTLMEQ